MAKPSSILGSYSRMMNGSSSWNRYNICDGNSREIGEVAIEKSSSIVEDKKTIYS